jgi:hypothetical protein
VKYWFDTEFLEDGKTVELISFGAKAEDGRTYYAVNGDVNQERARAHDFISREVWPQLPLLPDGSLDLSNPLVLSKEAIARQVWEFLTFGLQEGERAELWAYFGAYDHVVLAQLYGPMINMPKGLPWFTHELMQLWETSGKPEKPPHGKGHHNALQDALWNERLYAACLDAQGLRAAARSAAASGESCTNACTHPPFPHLGDSDGQGS